MSTTFATIQLKRDTAANWASGNPVLLSGETGISYDGSNYIVKFGNGTDAWNDLPGLVSTETLQEVIGSFDLIPAVKLTKPLFIRPQGLVDDYVYARGADIQVAYDGPTDTLDTARLGSYFGFTLSERNSSDNSFFGLQNYFSIGGTQTGGAAVATAFSSTIAQTGTGRFHDLRAGSFETQIVNGQVYSNAEGINANVAVFGGNANHGDLACISAGATTFSNATARSVQLLWLSQPSFDTFTTTDWRFAIRLDNASKVPLFTVNLEGTQLGLTQSTPASSGATGRTGVISVDADYIYVCTGTNQWKRIALGSF